MDFQFDSYRIDDNADANFIDAIDVATSDDGFAKKMKIMMNKLKNWNARGVSTVSAACTICHKRYSRVRHFENHIKTHGKLSEWISHIPLLVNQCIAFN